MLVPEPEASDIAQVGLVMLGRSSPTEAAAPRG
jgi:hypothetical protein